MSSNIYSLPELLARINITEELLSSWEKAGLVKPIGFTDDKMPFFSQEDVNKLLQIQKLVELGYDVPEILKIVKKIGLPKHALDAATNFKHKSHLTVGDLAEHVGVSARTIKHWEDKGIIVPDLRSEGGFRLYSESYIFLCKLIIDLQLFGYTLEEIKAISDYFRDFLAIQKGWTQLPKGEVDQKLQVISDTIQKLFEKMNLFKDGIQRWEELLKKKKKEVAALKTQNLKREAAEADSKTPT